MVRDVADALVVEFPLRGEGWVAINSPGDHIPSHGTDLLGQRFAFDFLMADKRRGLHYHPAGWLHTFFLGVPTQECYAWGAPIHSVFDGQVVRAVDGSYERARIHPVREAGLLLRNARSFSPSRLPSILGNHVIVRSGHAFAGFAHLAAGSVNVAVGQEVRAGDVIGRVGQSGNSTTPHLHFQLMDAADPLVARGLPCAFRTYEVRRTEGWVEVRDGIPRRADRLRCVEAQP